MPEQTQSNNLSVPIAIVVAGALVAAALYFGGGGSSGGSALPTGDENRKDVPAVTADDHIIGNPNAKVILVEYTDLECPFCKQFHATMKKIMDEYGPAGQVAWVVRNFPLSQLHPNAPQIAYAAECVAKVNGNSAYWDFVDEIFTRAPINTFFELADLADAAEAAGADVDAFQSCYDGEETRATVEKQFNDAAESGGRGTPFNTLVLKDKISSKGRQTIEAYLKNLPPGSPPPFTILASGKNIEIAGAQPYETVKIAIDAALQ